MDAGVSVTHLASVLFRTSPAKGGMPVTQLPGRTLLILPAWNEARSIGAVLSEIALELPQVDVLVVDDGSSDGTADVVRAHGVTVLQLPFNLGVGGAMRAGFRYAHRRHYDVVVQVDADGQHDPRFVPLLVSELRQADIVIGARFAGVGNYSVRGPRRWAMRLLARTLSRRTGTTLTDATSGFRASSARAVALFAEHYPAEYLGDTVESLVIASRAGLVVRQVPVAMRLRIAGSPSQGTWKSTVYLFRAQLALLLALIRRWPSMPAVLGSQDLDEVHR